MKLIFGFVLLALVAASVLSLYGWASYTDVLLSASYDSSISASCSKDTVSCIVGNARLCCSSGYSCVVLHNEDLSSSPYCNPSGESSCPSDTSYCNPEGGITQTCCSQGSVCSLDSAGYAVCIDEVIGVDSP